MRERGAEGEQGLAGPSAALPPVSVGGWEGTRPRTAVRAASAAAAEQGSTAP